MNIHECKILFCTCKKGKKKKKETFIKYESEEDKEQDK